MTEYGVPYLASFSWYLYWIRCRLAGLTPSESAETAWRQCNQKPREWSRTVLEIGGEDSVLRLTVPLVGGASTAKKGIYANPEISDHGDWQRLHIGALNAVLGHTPYSSYFLPEIRNIISTTPEKLIDLNFKLHKVVLELMDIENIIQFIGKNKKNLHKKAVIETGEEMMKTINPEESIVVPLSHFGPRLILSLLNLKEGNY